MGTAFSSVEGRSLTLARAGSSVLPETGAPPLGLDCNLAKEQLSFSRGNGTGALLHWCCKSMHGAV